MALITKVVELPAQQITEVMSKDELIKFHARERQRRYRSSHKQQLQDYEIKNITHRRKLTSEIRKRDRIQARMVKAIYCIYLGCDKILFSKNQLKNHLHNDHKLKRILKCQRCQLIITHLLPQPQKIISNVIIKRKQKPRFKKIIQLPKQKKVRRKKFDMLMQKLQQGEDKLIGIRVHIQYPDHDGFISYGKYTIRKPFSQWVKFANNPPNEISLKDTFNVALLTAIFLFKEEYKIV